MTTASRRHVLKAVAGLGVGSLVFQRALAAQIDQQPTVTSQMVEQAEWIAGLQLEPEVREQTARDLNRTLQRVQYVRSKDLDGNLTPAVHFFAEPPRTEAPPPNEPVVYPNNRNVARPQSDGELAFLTTAQLASLLDQKKISSVELTKLYLDRLRRHDETLLCVVNLTEELALDQAARADRERAAGRVRGPLHGIPWGAKDLISWPGYPTTWGAPQYQNRIIDQKATVAQRLENAGAVLVAKLSLGALAQGDKWYRGMTRNPWDPEQGSSGSSAGSASATSAGLVGFALGSETLGSIVSPCRRCGVTGLRPTFGRVSRHGCMALTWSMDKIGPIARSVEDCALIFAAIHGSDGLDFTAIQRPFSWRPKQSLDGIRVGYQDDGNSPDQREELRALKGLGARLVPITVPDSSKAWPLVLILNTEAAAAFDALTRSGNLEGLNRWPRVFREGQFVPAVDYLRAQRVRAQLMQEMKPIFNDVDVYVGIDDLALTNLTGHPCVVVPNGFEEDDGVAHPTALTFTGDLFDEQRLLSVAHAYQTATGHHLKRPPRYS